MVCVDATILLVPLPHVATRGFTVVVLGSIIELRNVIVSMVAHSIWKLTSHIEPGVPKIGITRGVTVTDEIVIHAEDVEGGIPGVAFGHVVLFW